MLDKLKRKYMVAVVDQATNIVLDLHEVRAILDLFEDLKNEQEYYYYCNNELVMATLEDRIEELEKQVVLLGGEIE